MGRAKILENLGEGHYRIGLDLDLSYARRQLAEAQAYLAAFAARYQAAQDAVTDARAALVTVNDDLSSYLSAAQAACEAAYQAERAAYQDYIDAVNSQPAPGVAAGLLATAEAAHEAFMGVFTDELAMAATAADADYQAGVGLFLDEPAVLNAEAVKLSGLSALLTARDEYADDLITLAEYQAAQNAYDTLRGDWLTVIADNSGDPLVKHYKAIWDAARDAFDKARNDLGKLIGNGGGIPAELEALLKKQAETYAALRAAEKDLQSLTLIKAEKERFILELTQRLAPYTDESGDPVFPPVNAWCVDYTDDLAVDATVGTIEIPGERYLSVRVRPGYESRETWNAEREGLLSPSWSMSPETTWFNWALHPGNARWNPNARLGVIQAIDSNAETCTVVLDPQSNSPATVAPEGAVMEVNNPIKYVIDENGVEQTVLPGPNVTVVEGVTILVNVPIEYMECNSGAFVVGDHVMVQFTGQDWAAPKVVGFAEEPKPCNLPGVRLSAIVNGQPESVFLRDMYVSTGQLTHPKTAAGGGNLDWVSADGKTRVTFAGPPGRSIAPAILPGRIDPIYNFSYDDPYFYGGKRHRFRMLFGSDTPQGTDSNPHPAMFVRTITAGSTIYVNGKAAPDLTGYHALGAGVCEYADDEVTRKYLIGVFNADLVDDFEDHEAVMRCFDVITRPQMINVVFACSVLSGTTAGPWTVLHTEDLASAGDIMPPINAVFFSADGLHCVTTLPTLSQGSITATYIENGTFSQTFDSYSVGNDCLLRATLTPGRETVSVAVSVRYQDDQSRIYEKIQTHSSEGDYGWYSDSSSLSDQASGSAILALDFVGNTEVALFAEWAENMSQSGSDSGTTDEGSVQGAGAGGNTRARSGSWTLTDLYRDKVIGQLSTEYSYSSSDSWLGIDLGDSGSVSEDSQLSFDNSGTISRPYYYDLRTGSGVWYQATGNHSYTYSGNATYSSDYPYWVLSRTDSVNLYINGRFVDRETNTIAENTTDVGNSRTWGSQTEDYSTRAGSGVSPPYSNNRESGSPAVESGVNVLRVWPWYETYYYDLEGTGALITPTISTQRCGPIGNADIILSIRFDVFQQIEPPRNYRSGFDQYLIDAAYFFEPTAEAYFSHRISFNDVYCSAFNIGQAWTSHLRASHPDAEPPETTPEMAELTPIYRV